MGPFLRLFVKALGPILAFYLPFALVSSRSVRLTFRLPLLIGGAGIQGAILLALLILQAFYPVSVGWILYGLSLPFLLNLGLLFGLLTPSLRRYLALQKTLGPEEGGDSRLASLLQLSPLSDEALTLLVHDLKVWGAQLRRRDREWIRVGRQEGKKVTYPLAGGHVLCLFGLEEADASRVHLWVAVLNQALRAEEVEAREQSLKEVHRLIEAAVRLLTEEEPGGYRWDPARGQFVRDPYFWQVLREDGLVEGIYVPGARPPLSPDLLAVLPEEDWVILWRRGWALTFPHRPEAVRVLDALLP